MDVTSQDENPSPEPGATTPPPDEPATTGWLTKGVAGVGLSSFFSDTGHEIATAVLPSFLTSTLHAGPGALGVIEGVSDALTGITKLAGGPLADDPTRRGRLAQGGYLVTALAAGALGAVTATWQLALLRATAWSARGLRSPARDALLGSLAPRGAYGRAYGLERAGDNLGAVAGPLLAVALVTAIGLRPTLYLSAIPGLFAAATITLAAREARRTLQEPTARTRARGQLRALRHAGITRPMIPIALFELGNMATTLLILRATTTLHHGTRSLTTATALAILLYAAHNALAAAVSYTAGTILDRTGPRPIFATGAAAYVAAYLLLAFTGNHWIPLLLGFILAGTGIGCAETAESTLIARKLPDHLRGSGFGVLGAVQAAGDLGSSAVVGLLWSTVSATTAFAYAAAWMLAAGVAALSPATHLQTEAD